MEEENVHPSATIGQIYRYRGPLSYVVTGGLKKLLTDRGDRIDDEGVAAGAPGTRN